MSSVVEATKLLTKLFDEQRLVDVKFFLQAGNDVSRRDLLDEVAWVLTSMKTGNYTLLGSAGTEKPNS